MLLLGAVARKLIFVIYGVLKEQRPFKEFLFLYITMIYQLTTGYLSCKFLNKKLF